MHGSMWLEVYHWPVSSLVSMHVRLVEGSETIFGMGCAHGAGRTAMSSTEPKIRGGRSVA